MKRDTISYLKDLSNKRTYSHEYLCLNVGAAKYINQLITKVKTYLDNNTLIIGDFNVVLSILDRSSNHNISKETRASNNTLDQMDFTDIYSILHLNATEYTFFSSAHGTFSRIDHILDHKLGLSR